MVYEKYANAPRVTNIFIEVLSTAPFDITCCRKEEKDCVQTWKIYFVYKQITTLKTCGVPISCTKHWKLEQIFLKQFFGGVFELFQ